MEDESGRDIKDLRQLMDDNKPKPSDNFPVWAIVVTVILVVLLLLAVAWCIYKQCMASKSEAEKLARQQSATPPKPKNEAEPHVVAADMLV